VEIQIHVTTLVRRTLVEVCTVPVLLGIVIINTTARLTVSLSQKNAAGALCKMVVA